MLETSGSFHKHIQKSLNARLCALDTDVFGTADPFGSNSFGSKAGGFADFSQMSKVRGAGCYRNKSAPFFPLKLQKTAAFVFSFAMCDFSLCCTLVYLIQGQCILIKHNRIVHYARVFLCSFLAFRFSTGGVPGPTFFPLSPRIKTPAHCLSCQVNK